jgi:urease accessory protein
MTEPLSAKDLVTLTQWLSPAFPVGGFAFSHGLDHAVAAGDLRDAGDVAAWLRAVLRFGAGRSDAILLAQAHGGGDVTALDDLAQALCAGRERLVETQAQGRAFTLLTNTLLATDLVPCALPVAVGAQARHLSLTTPTIASLYLHAFASNLASIATRIVPLGQTEAQRLLADLGADIAQLGTEAATASLDDLGSGVPGGDLAALLHETQDVRLFQS